MVLVPVGEMDHFAAERLVDVATSRIDADLGRLVIDLSALSFCDSSVGRIVEWASEVNGDLAVAVVLGDAVERMLELLPDPDGLLVGLDDVR